MVSHGRIFRSRSLPFVCRPGARVTQATAFAGGDAGISCPPHRGGPADPRSLGQRVVPRAERGPPGADCGWRWWRRQPWGVYFPPRERSAAVRSCGSG